jgi:glycosyltransferase involved in cell wall biosynthesis
MPTFSGRGDCIYPLDERVKLEYLADRVAGGGRGILARIRRLLVLRAYMKHNCVDVVVSFLTHVNVAAILASRGLSVPVVVSERTYPPAMPLGRMLEFLRRETYRWAESVVAQTEETAAWLTERCAKARVCTIGNPVVLPLPVGGGVLVPDEWVSASRQIIVAAGRLGEEKGFNQLIEAFANLADSCPNWDLVILGEGELRNSLQEMRTERGLEERVHLPGQAGNLGDWYKRADLYVLSSRYEGFPNTLLEAMAHGLPVVSYDCKAGPRDIISNGFDGILVPPESGVAGLTEALGKLMKNAALREQMGKAAVDVGVRYSIERICKSWFDVLGIGVSDDEETGTFK